MGNQTNKLTKTFQTVNNFFRQPNFFASESFLERIITMYFAVGPL